MLFLTILCGFDSISFGARAEVGGHAGLGYPEHLASIMSEQAGSECAVLNRGISGQTIRQIADRAPGAFRELLAYAGPRWAVVLAGTNDAKHPGVPLDEWEVLYRQTISWGRRAVVPLALCTFPPIRGAAMPAFGPNAQAWADAASARVRALVAELDGNPSPVVLVELADMPDSLLCDGVHLSAVGYRALALRVADALRFLPPRPWTEIVAEAVAWFEVADGSRVARPDLAAESCTADPGGKKRGGKKAKPATAEA